MDSSVEEIKKKIDIIDFLGSYIQVKKTGRNFKALCPFHQEKTASFVVSPERQIWHCFGSCGDGGDIFKFLMKWDNITFSEALIELARKAGVTLTKVQFEDKEWSKKQRLLKVNTLCGEFFEYLLHNTKFGENARNYLATRKINTAIVKKFQLGYAPSSWNSLLTFLKKKDYREEEMHDLGFVVKNNSGRYYDRFRGRLMFPIKDIRGNTLGFSGRTLEGGNEEAKYINTPETPLYRKRETLFGIHLAKDAIKKAENVLLVEGEFDMISPYQNGIENVVAIKGSAVTKEQVQLLSRFTPKVTLALDADSAGEEAVRRALSNVEEVEMEAHVVFFENGKDPDEAVRADPVSFKKSIEHSVSIYDFIIQLAQKKYATQGVYAKKKVGDDVVPYIARIQNPIIQSHYVKKLSYLLEVSEESVVELMRKQRSKTKYQRQFSPKKTNQSVFQREELLQNYLLGLLFQSDNPYGLSDKIFNVLTIDDLIIPSLQKLCTVFFTYREKHPSAFELSKFVDSLSPELKAVFDQAYLFSSADVGYEGINLEKMVLEVKKSTLKKRIANLLHDTENYDKREGELKIFTQSLAEVEKRIASV